MKMLIAAAALSVIAGAAYAGEGEGNPFPYQAPTTPFSLNGYKQAPGTSQNPYPFLVPGQAVAEEQVISPVGSAGEPQSANSLPRGFEDGTAVGATASHVTPSPTRTAQPAARNTRG